MLRKFSLCIFCLSATHLVHAQEFRTYNVIVAPIVSIQALDGFQSQTHTLAPGNVDFLESRWTLTSNVPAGASVTFAATPFQNDTDSNVRRDVQLRLQNLVADAGSNWTYNDRTDRSLYLRGDLNASVSLSSGNAGSATVRVRVRFITEGNPAARLRAGTYATTLVGTISAN